MAITTAIATPTPKIPTMAPGPSAPEEAIRPGKINIANIHIQTAEQKKHPSAANFNPKMLLHTFDLFIFSPYRQVLKNRQTFFVSQYTLPVTATKIDLRTSKF